MTAVVASPIEGISRVAVIGLGTIGMRWAAFFAHAGLVVDAHDPDREAGARFAAARPTLDADLAALSGPGRGTGVVVVHDTLASALAEADFVQENAPERLELKQSLLAEIDRLAPAAAVIASSSSALMPSALRERCARPWRVIVAHPFNPAHLMPLVELVGGEGAEEAVERARAFYEALGRKPVVLGRELTGHLALRLMGAMWREAIALIAEGSVSARDVDRAFAYGPGPKWTLQGSFVSNHLGAEGMASFLERYGGTYQAIWDDLRPAPDLGDRAVRDLVVRETEAALAGRGNEDLRRERDAGLLAILATQARHGA